MTIEHASYAVKELSKPPFVGAASARPEGFGKRSTGLVIPAKAGVQRRRSQSRNQAFGVSQGSRQAGSEKRFDKSLIAKADKRVQAHLDRLGAAKLGAAKLGAAKLGAAKRKKT